MNIKIIISNLFHKPLGTLLSLLLMGFGVGLISFILQISEQIEQKFTDDMQGIDLVVGAKGSPLQLILSAIYQIDNPTGNIPLGEMDKLRKNHLVEKVVPLAYGDSYSSYRIVGTDSNYIAHYKARLDKGKLFRQDLDAVLGYEVAQKIGLHLGDTFYGTHGLGEEGHEHKEFVYKVTGILKPTGKVIDQLILTNVSSVWKIHEHGHDHEHTDEERQTHADENPEKEITAMLVTLRSPMGMITLPNLISQSTSMQAVSPNLEIMRLFDVLGIGITAIQGIAFCIVLLAGLSVFIALYNRLKERNYELALARTMGASRGRLAFLTIAEGLILCIVGYLTGMLFSRLGLYIIGLFAEKTQHIRFDAFRFGMTDVYLLCLNLLLGLIAAFLPAVKAFTLNISKTLSHE